MRRRLAAPGAVGLLVVSLALSACGPAVPHSLEGRSDCLSCHGQNGVKPYPEWHAERGLGNDVCVKCHELAADAGRR